MSFDLYFAPKPGREVPSWKEITAYFENRKYYEIDHPNIEYENKDTGVYFVFHYISNDITYDHLIDFVFTSIMDFNINLVRPHYFGLEAMTEVGDFLRHFKFDVLDAQPEVRVDKTYAGKDFFESWLRSNNNSYLAILEVTGTVYFFFLSTDRLDKIWQWNYTKSENEKELCDTAFVAPISFILVDGELATFAVWTDDISIVLPEVDLVAFARMDLAPRHEADSLATDFAFVAWSDIAELLAGFETGSEPLPFVSALYYEPPSKITEFVRALPTADLSRYRLVDNAVVLNAETWREAVAKVERSPH